MEYINNEKIRIIYHRKNEHSVCQMLTYLFPAIESQFGKEIAEMLLGDKDTQMSHIKAKNVEYTYSSACATSIVQRSNTQEAIVNHPPKIKFNSNFGSAPKTVVYNDTQRRKSYSAVSREQTNQPCPEIQAAIKALQEQQIEQSKTIIELNEQVRATNEAKNNEKFENNDETENNEDNDVTDEMREEIKALWKSQEQIKQELRATIDEQVSTSKDEILQVVEANKTIISKEIENLKSHQDAAHKQFQEQQSVNTFNVLTAIETIKKRLDEMNASPQTLPVNPPIRPVEHGSWHGGEA